MNAPDTLTAPSPTESPTDEVAIRQARVDLAALHRIVVLENLHEADASIEALKYLVHRLAAAPVMIAGTWRPAQTDRGHPLHKLIRTLVGHPRVLSLTVEPLSAAEVRELAGHVVGSSRLRDSLVERLHETTEGNPLFVRELIRSMSTDKLIIISTHILEEVEAVCTRAMIIADGRLLVDDTPEALAAQGDGDLDEVFRRITQGAATEPQETVP